MRFLISSLLLFAGWHVSFFGHAQTTGHEFPMYYTQHAFHADEIQLEPHQKTAMSDVVINADVVATRSIWDDHRFTSELDLMTYDGQSYIVSLQGGAWKNMGSFHSGEMYLNTGASGVFYLQLAQNGTWVPACGTQSFERDERSDVHAMGWQRSDLVLDTDWSAGNANEFITITGAGFGSVQGSGFVTFDNGGNYYDAATASGFNYTEWTDNSITVQVPQAFSNRVRLTTDDGTMLETNDSLHIAYNLDTDASGVYGHTHLHDQNSGGLLFHVNEGLFDVPERMDAIERTLNDFVCKTGVNFQLENESTALGWDLGDGQNTISFDSPSNPLSSSSVGYCHTLWYSCVLGNVTFYYVGEIDVVINGSFDYDYSTGTVATGQAKFAYVLMHELGHAMRLGHVNELSETMYPSVTDWPSNEWNERDTISTNDRVGVTLVVDRASVFTFDGCGVSPMIPLEVDCPEAVNISEGTANQMETWRLHPNPFQNKIFLSTPGDGITPHWVRIWDATGRQVEEVIIPPSGLEWNASKLTPGWYHFQCLDCTEPNSGSVLKTQH
jgi:hypothetical protein